MDMRSGERLFLYFLGYTALSWSQVVGGSMTGTVKDDSGAAIPEANVIVKNQETGTERRAVTDEAGRYAIFSVAIGRYEVLAEKAGFTTGRRTGIELVVGQTVSIDLTLPV